jgi:hypothetical protein
MMTIKEARLFKRLLRERIQVFGKCRMLSEGNACTCALCQLDRIDAKELRKTVQKYVQRGFTGLERQAFIS